jgi:hypothetical protein
LTFGYFYDYFIRHYRMKIAENNRDRRFSRNEWNRRPRSLAGEITR